LNLDDCIDNFELLKAEKNKLGNQTKAFVIAHFLKMKFMLEKIFQSKSFHLSTLLEQLSKKLFLNL